MTVGEIGEFALIEQVTGRLRGGPSCLLGPGDDAAVVRAADGRVVVSTDLLVEGSHFRRDWSSAEDVGVKAAAQNLADIAAMGAVPTALLVGLACPRDLPVVWAREFTAAFDAECALVGAVLVGGDVSSSPTLTVAVTALGDLEGRAPVTRAAAEPGDVVALTGRLGWSAAGFAVLSRGFRSPAQIIAAHRRPTPPYAEGPVAAVCGATSMCDVSDGLVQDLGHIAAASAVQIGIETARLEVGPRLQDVGRALNVDPMRWLLTGGEDHALVATFPSAASVPGAWTVIGRVDEGEGVLVDGAAYPLPGWDSFRT
ncbi:MAG: thiamine-phosphate kinase [Geodermatophilaceae bacterium]|nr:thiamine-phosphate kinase [Geodermatophilaceae bacterium]MDQ3463186.1 thiamine-phosphate kinase [Actinomycetota bacterium]